MADKKNDKVNVVNQTSGEKRKEDYRESDLRQIFEDSHAKSWKEAADFVAQKGDAQWHITPGEAKSLKEDLSRADSQGIPFTGNASEAYKKIHK